MTHDEVLAAVRDRPHSTARDVAVTMGIRTGRGNVAIVRHYLERLEIRGKVQRMRPSPGSGWLWEACPERPAAEEP
jgi:putative heme degradation protein